MANEIPFPQPPSPDKIGDILSGLLTFPPKFAPITDLLGEPEASFERTAANMGFALPPGPAKMASQTLKSFESGITSITPPLPVFKKATYVSPVSTVAGRAPAVLPPTAPSGISQGTPEKIEISPVKAKKGIEIIEA